MLRTRYLLYISNSLSRWGDRMWSFAIGIFLIHLHPSSLIVSASYQLVVKMANFWLAGLIGQQLDRFPRLVTMRLCLLIQNLSVAIASILIVIAFRLNISYYCDSSLFYLFMVLVTVFGVISSLSSSASKVVIERDWIVVLAGQEVGALSAINATMRRIDQVCLLLAPILSGAFVSAVSAAWAAALIAVWNIVSFFFEYALLRVVYTRVPELAVKKEGEKQADGKEKKDKMWPPHHAFSSYIKSLKVFFSQDVATMGICLSLVYLTVLGFDAITVAYLRLSNLTDFYIGLSMAGGALLGVIGTVCYTPFTERWGVISSGLIGAVCLAVSYCVCLGSTALPTNVTEIVTPSNNTTCNAVTEELLDVSGPVLSSTVMLLIGIITIRFGLWIYDLAISQAFQLSVPEHQRNTVGGVQNSFNSLFDCIAIVLTVIFSDVKKFNILIFVSSAGCIGSCLIYMLWCCNAPHLDEKKKEEGFSGVPDGTDRSSASKDETELEHSKDVVENPVSV